MSEPIREFKPSMAKELASNRIHDIEIDGIAFHVRMINGREREDFEDFVKKNSTQHGKEVKIKTTRGMRGALLSRVMCDAEGNLLYAPNNADDILELPSDIIQKLWDEATVFLGVSKKAKETELEN